MTDIDLANKIVALGVAARSSEAYALIGDDTDDFYTYAMGKASEFVRDWRVAGALIEKCQKIYIEYIGDPEQTAVALTVYARAENNRTWDWKFGESLPRTINEACVEALND